MKEEIMNIKQRISTSVSLQQFKLYVMTQTIMKHKKQRQ